LHGKPRFAATNSGIDHFTRHKTSLVLVMSLKESQQRLRAFAEDLERLVESRTSELGQSQEQLRALAAQLTFKATYNGARSTTSPASNGSSANVVN